MKFEAKGVSPCKLYCKALLRMEFNTRGVSSSPGVWPLPIFEKHNKQNVIITKSNMILSLTNVLLGLKQGLVLQKHNCQLITGLASCVVEGVPVSERSTLAA